MKTLLTIFGKEQNSLKAEIERATSLDQVVKLVQNQLDHLERVYMSELSISQVRLASFFLDTLRQSIATLAVANSTQVISEPSKPSVVDSNNKYSTNRLILKIIQGLICLGILGSLFSLTRIAPGVWMAILLTALLVGVEVVLQLDKNAVSNNSTSIQSPETPQFAVRVDSTVLLNHLTDALNTIDKAVGQAKETNQPIDSNSLEELPELLNLIQRLMGASLLNKPQMAFELSKLLPQILREQGIRAEIYQPNEKLCDRKYFDFEPSIDRSAKEYVTVTPALVKSDRLLLKGRVIEPARTEA